MTTPFPTTPTHGSGQHLITSVVRGIRCTRGWCADDKKTGREMILVEFTLPEAHELWYLIDCDCGYTTLCTRTAPGSPARTQTLECAGCKQVQTLYEVGVGAKTDVMLRECLRSMRDVRTTDHPVGALDVEHFNPTEIRAYAPSIRDVVQP